MSYTTPLGTFKYSFSIHTPNAQNAYGTILQSSIIVGSLSPVLIPHTILPVYKEKDDVIDYYNFIRAAGFFCIINIIVESLNQSCKELNDPAYIFHHQLRDINRTAVQDREDFLTTGHYRGDNTKRLTYKERAYPANEALTSFGTYPAEMLKGLEKTTSGDEFKY